jgi:hypothetical protein
LRVVALRSDPSLGAALNMTTDWEVVYADDPEQAALIIAGANVVLIGGGTEEGLRLAESIRTLGITIPAVVVGDTPVFGAARHAVLIPPFTLDDLHAVVARAVAGAEQSVPVSALEADEVKREPLAASEAAASKAAAAADNEPSRSRLTVVREEPAPMPVAAARAASIAEAAPAPVSPTATSPAASTTLEPSPLPPVTTKVQPPAGERQRPPKSVGAPAGRGLLRRRARTEAVSEEAPVYEQLRAAFDGIVSVEKAIDELPVLIDLAGLAEALIGEVVDLLTPDTAGIYLPGPGGFRVWASHGFSNVEKNMAVQSH